MNSSSPFGLPPQFDPSKMDPRVLMELSQLISQLPKDQLGRMQTLMHNMMAGHDVRRDMEEFEKSLPSGFREKLLSMMSQQGTSQPDVVIPQTLSAAEQEEMSLREARMTILRGVSEGKLTPEDAERLLFQQSA